VVVVETGGRYGRQAVTGRVVLVGNMGRCRVHRMSGRRGSVGKVSRRRQRAARSRQAVVLPGKAVPAAGCVTQRVVGGRVGLGVACRLSETASGVARFAYQPRRYGSSSVLQW